MTGAPDAPRRRRRRWPWIVGGIALAWLVVLVLLPGSRKPFDDEVARLRAAGFATSIEEWYGPMPPDEENGAIVLLDALEQLEAAMGKEGLWELTRPWDSAAAGGWDKTASAEELVALRHKLATAAPFFERLDAALAKPRFKFPLAVDDGGEADIAAFGASRRTQKLLHARAVVAATAPQRIEAIRAMVRLCSRPEPRQHIDLMVGYAIRGHASALAQAAVETGTLTAAQARDALSPWPAERAIDAVGDFARAELGLSASDFDAILDGRATWDLAKPRSASDRAQELFDRVIRRRPRHRPFSVDDPLFAVRAAESLRLWAEIAEHRAGTYAETLAWAESIESRVPDGIGGRFHVVPVVVEKLIQVDARVSLARVALAAAARHEATGAWPASLDALAADLPGGVPEDPITGAPFVYEVGERTVRLTTSAPAPEEVQRDGWLRNHGLLWEFPR